MVRCGFPFQLKIEKDYIYSFEELRELEISISHFYILLFEEY